MSRRTANPSQPPFAKGGANPSWTPLASAGQIAAVRHHFFVKPEPPYAEIPRRALLLLNPAQMEKVARNKAAVCEHMPELVPFIRELHEAGMIDGWRGVIEVGVFQNA